LTQVYAHFNMRPLQYIILKTACRPGITPENIYVKSMSNPRNLRELRRCTFILKISTWILSTWIKSTWDLYWYRMPTQKSTWILCCLSMWQRLDFAGCFCWECSRRVVR